MAGVVRRDGLREAVTAVLRDHNLVSYFGDGKCMGCDVALFEGKITSTADLKLASEAAAEHRADMLLALLDAVPDVPPDPPTADLADDLALDYIRAYYALVTAARALLDAMTRFGPDDSGQLWDAAQALRALVGDETPGTGDGA